MISECKGIFIFHVNDARVKGKHKSRIDVVVYTDNRRALWHFIIRLITHILHDRVYQRAGL